MVNIKKKDDCGSWRKLYKHGLCGARQLLGHQSSLQDALSFLLKRNQNASVNTRDGN